MSRRRTILVTLVLALITLAVYAPVRRFDFVNYDDGTYVTDNAVVAAGLTWHGVMWAFTTGHDPYWHPLTWLSHMLDVQLFGMSAGGQHLTNVWLSVINTWLVFFILWRITGAVWRSAFVAALFAVHPLRVESIAWIAERKDLLSACFLFLTIAAYCRYVENPARNRYLWVMAAFIAALMTKPIVVTLPLLLLLLDVWPLRRRPSLVEKLPLAGLAAVAGVITLVVQQHVGAVAGLDRLPLSTRVGHALVAYISYIRLLFWPAGLAVFYPYPRTPEPIAIVAAAAGLLVAISWAVVRQRKQRPYLFVGWFWYLVTLLPVIGLVQSGDQSIADRFTYLPFLGLFVIVAWGFGELAAGWRQARALVPAVAIAAVVACGVVSSRQLATWQNSQTLWTQALGVTADNHRAEGGLANALASSGQYAQALPYYEEAHRLAPDSEEWRTDLGSAHNHLGVSLAREKRTDEAIEQYAAAIDVEPDYALAHNNLAIALADEGKFAEALNEVDEALHLDPSHADWHVERGSFLYHAGKDAEAIAEFERALQIDPHQDAARQALSALRFKQ